MHSLVHAWAKNWFHSKEHKAQTWSATGSVLSLALSVRNDEIWLTHGRQLRPHAHSYLSFYTREKGQSDSFEMVLPILFAFASFLDQMRDDKIVANLLKQIFKDLCIDPRSPSVESIHLMPLYNLQAENLRRMGNNKYATQLL